MIQKVAIIIPVYRHASKLESMLIRLSKFEVPIIVIDDGNDLEDRKVISELSSSYNFSLCVHEKNRGKGASVYSGFEEALKQGFTHVLQIDADGQHEVEDIPKFLKASENHPSHLILGAPLFDANAPAARVWGRKITNYLVRLETFNFKLKDALFGFRLYPIAQTLRAYPKAEIRERMGFDVEVLIKLLLHGSQIVTIYTPVYYPSDGISNFKYVDDNLQMIKMHIGILIATPLNLLKKYFYY